MDVGSFIVAGYALVFAAAIVAIIYLIVRRRRISKEETFEKRDN